MIISRRGNFNSVLQLLKQQYQQKQLQLQQQRQQLLSQAVNNSAVQGEEQVRRQPIPLHIALQNHLNAHHVTEGNVNDLASALQDWDTRDRNAAVPQTLVKVRTSLFSICHCNIFWFGVFQCVMLDCLVLRCSAYETWPFRFIPAIWDRR